MRRWLEWREKLVEIGTPVDMDFREIQRFAQRGDFFVFF